MLMLWGEMFFMYETSSKYVWLEWHDQDGAS